MTEHNTVSLYFRFPSLPPVFGATSYLCQVLRPARDKQNQFALIVFIFFAVDNSAGSLKDSAPEYSVAPCPPPLNGFASAL